MKVIFCILGSVMCVFAICVTKLIDFEGNLIAIDAGMTIAWILGRACFNIGGTFYTRVQFKFLDSTKRFLPEETREKLDKGLKTLVLYSGTALQATQTVLNCITLVSVFVDEDTRHMLFFVWAGCTGCTYVIFVIQMTRFNGFMAKLFSMNATKSSGKGAQKLEQGQLKLMATIKAANSGFFLMMLTTIIFIIPPLNHQFTFWVPSSMFLQWLYVMKLIKFFSPTAVGAATGAESSAMTSDGGAQSSGKPKSSDVADVNVSTTNSAA